VCLFVLLRAPSVTGVCLCERFSLFIYFSDYIAAEAQKNAHAIKKKKGKKWRK
jgi:hypothetical protein